VTSDHLFRTARKREVRDALVILSGGSSAMLRLDWIPYVKDFGVRLITSGLGGIDRATPAYVPLVPGRLSYSFDEVWTEQQPGALILKSSRLVLHDPVRDFIDVLALEAEPHCEGPESHIPFKRMWHMHMKELPLPWRKMHFAVFPRSAQKRLRCYTANERTELNAKLKRIVRMLRVEVVERRWPEWSPNAV
jgi:hypothetical protein